MLLSMGRYSTEIDIKLHRTIKDCFKYAKLIGPGDGVMSLEEYSYELCSRYIKEQLRYFPNVMYTLDSFVVSSGDLFDSVIMNDELHISEMPPVQLSMLYASIEEDSVNHRKKHEEKCN